MAWRGVAVASLPPLARPIPAPFHSASSWEGPSDRPGPRDRPRLPRGMRQKSFAYAVLGFVCPFWDVTKPEITDRPRDGWLVGRSVRERELGGPTSCESSWRIATSPSLRVTFKKCSPECSLPGVRATLHEARGTACCRRHQPQKRRDLSSLTRVFMRQSGVESEPGFASLREMCPPEPRQTKQGR